MPGVPIRLSVPVSELAWHRHSWLLVPSMILVAGLVAELVAAIRLGFEGSPVLVLYGAGGAACVAALTYPLARSDMSGLCETAILHDDCIVLVRDGRRIVLRWGDVDSVVSGWPKHYWMRYPVELRGRVNGRTVRLCFFPRKDPEFRQWKLGSPYEALYALSGRGAHSEQEHT